MKYKGAYIMALLIGFLWFTLAGITLFFTDNYEKAIVFAIFAVFWELCAIEEKMKW
jgi:branched-subunit amino acid ABC-type transport system permease component